MRHLSPPNMYSKEVLETCISNVQDASLCSNVHSSMPVFENAEEIYKSKALNNELGAISVHNNVNNLITTKQMKFLYDKMVNKDNKEAREYYDLLLASSKDCPFCGYGISTTLDHFLPKSLYPIYAVTPINLVPCCKDCNTTKLTMTAEEGIWALHPYFDIVDDSRWLYCDIEVFPETVAFRFKVVKPQTWTDVKYKRMKYHFKAFNLNRLLVGRTIGEFSDSLYQLKGLFLKSEEAIKEDLHNKYLSCNDHLINHWKTAMYDNLKDSNQFLEWLEIQVGQRV